MRRQTRRQENARRPPAAPRRGNQRLERRRPPRLERRRLQRRLDEISAWDGRGREPFQNVQTAVAADSSRLRRRCTFTITTSRGAFPPRASHRPLRRLVSRRRPRLGHHRRPRLVARNLLHNLPRAAPLNRLRTRHRAELFDEPSAKNFTFTVHTTKGRKKLEIDLRKGINQFRTNMKMHANACQMRRYVQMRVNASICAYMYGNMWKCVYMCVNLSTC